MSDNSLAEELKSIFQQVFHQGEISLEDSPSTLSEWDSIGHLALIEELMKVFQIDFTPEEINQMENVALVQKVLQEKNAFGK